MKMVTEFKVPAMACGACASAITNAIKEQYPDVVVDVNMENKTVIVHSSLDKEKIRNLIESVGYPVLA